MSSREAENRKIQVWELPTIRTRFTELYQTQNLSLKEVQKILLNEDHLDVSERMLKTQIKPWRLGRNKKESDVRALLRLYRLREAAGLPTKLKFYGREISVDELYRHVGRKGIKLEDIDNETIGFESLPKHLSCATPSDTSSPFVHEEDIADSYTGGNIFSCPEPDVEVPRLMTPVNYHRSNSLLHSIRTWYSTNFLLNNWILGTTDRDIHELYPSMQLGSCFQDHHNLMKLSQPVAAGSRLESAFGMLHYLVTFGDPRLITYLLESVSFTQSVGYDWLAAELVRRFAHVAGTALGFQHPVAVMAMALNSAGLYAQMELIEQALRCMIDEFSSHIGEYHVETMRLIQTASSILKHQKNLDAATALLQKLQLLSEVVYGRTSYQVSHALVDEAYIKLDQLQYGTAAGLITLAMRRAEGLPDWNEQVESRVRCQVALARYYGVQGDRDLMFSKLQLALTLGQEGGLDEQHWMIIDVRASIRDCQT